jgi:hypothetical protein
MLHYMGVIPSDPAFETAFVFLEQVNSALENNKTKIIENA